MKVLIAPDKFKGSLTAAEVVHHLGSGLEQRGIHYAGLPLADGGDGSVAAAVAAGFRSVEVDVAAATGERHTAAIAFDGATAVVEVANTCGLHTLPAGTLAPLDVLVGRARRRGPRRAAARRDADRPGARRVGQHRRRDGHARRPRGGVPRRGRAGRSPPTAAPCTGSTPSTSPACPT